MESGIDFVREIRLIYFESTSISQANGSFISKLKFLMVNDMAEIAIASANLFHILQQQIMQAALTQTAYES